MAARLFALALALFFVGVSCQPADPPSLLDIVDHSPQWVEPGDRFEVLGSGFPEGKRATITFRGTVFRPGRAPEPVRAVFPAASTSQNRISVRLDDAAIARFTGPGDEADHATFRGDLIAAFAPHVGGTAPITGTSREVVVEFEPALVAKDISFERTAEGRRALEWVGIEIGDQESAPALETPGPGAGVGLVVAAIDPGGRAERAGIAEGDLLVELDGVRLRSPSDFVPSSRQTSEIVLRRSGSRDAVTRVVDFEGFRPAPASDLAPAGVIVGVLVFLLLALMSPLARVLAWTGRRAAVRMRSTSGQRRRGFVGFAGWCLRSVGAVFRENIVPGHAEGWVSRLMPYLLLLGVSAAFTVIGLGRVLVGPDYDLAVAFLSAALVLATVGLVLGGWRGDGRWSLGAGLASGFHVTASLLPSLGAVAAVLVVTGSVRFSEIVGSQGGAPWQWHAFRSPPLLLAFVLFLTPLLAETSRAPSLLPEAEVDAAAPRLRHRAVRTLMFFAEWGNVFVLSALAVALFLGGWRLPGVDPLEHGASTPHLATGVVVFQVKCWVLILGVLWFRWVLPRFRVEQLPGLTWKWFVPLALLAVVGAVGWVRSQHHPIVRAGDAVLPYVLLGLFAAIGAWFAARVLADLRSSNRQVSMNPWL